MRLRLPIVVFLVAAILGQSCTAPCPCGLIVDPITRPTSIARPTDLILLTRAPLFEAVALNMHPSWSPDGRELVLERVPFHEGDPGLCVVRTDGTHPTMLGPTGRMMDPGWSPRNGWIAYWVSYKRSLMLLNREGQDNRLVTENGAVPSWSPDGERLVYERYQAQGNHDICVIDWQGTGFQTLLAGPADDIDPAWSPDGHRIAFSSDRDGVYNIYVMNADGSNITQITHATTGDPRRGMIQPTWSPDGIQIAFVCTSDTPSWLEGKLYVVNAAGGEPALLLDAEWCYDPAWSPDGTWLAFSYGGLNPSGPLGSDIYLLRMKR